MTGQRENYNNPPAGRQGFDGILQKRNEINSAVS